MKQKIKENILFSTLLGFSAVAFLLPAVIVAWIAFRGGAALSFSFLSQPESNFGSSGGILYQILGSLILVGAAALIAMPMGWTLGVLRETYLAKKSIHRWVDLTLYTLNGVPSIIFGLFGYLCFVKAMGLGISWFSGGLILGLMILPTVALTVAEGLASLPKEEIQAAEALGLYPWQLIWSVYGPESQRYLWTGLTLGLARAAGETAPIFFTAAVFSGVKIPESIKDPVVTLPTHIMTLVQEAANPIAIQNAWGTALVLVCVVAVFGGASWILRTRSLRSEFR